MTVPEIAHDEGPRTGVASRSDFVARHIGPDADQVASMLDRLGVEDLDQLIRQTIPEPIRYAGGFELAPGIGERAAQEELESIAAGNRLHRSFIGMGYYGTFMPAVIQRNVLENPSWYTAYTPYQAEISQGRLEALVNFQTMVCDLTGLPVANASLLDEATAAAEAMSVALGQASKKAEAALVFAVDRGCHPQTLDVVRTRARALGVEVRVHDARREGTPEGAFGLLLQVPATEGGVWDYEGVAREARERGVVVTVATDLLALAVLRSPGEMGAHMAVGSSQRFGVPMGFGGPHAGFLSAEEGLKRRLPGRVVGVSRDAAGRVGYRLALQTREQHIRREKATSNICTAQVLPAVLSAMYAVYHGAEGLEEIAERVHRRALSLASGVAGFGHDLDELPFFDTVRVTPRGLDPATLRERAEAARFNLRWLADGSVGISVDETTSAEHVARLISIFDTEAAGSAVPEPLPPSLRRSTAYLEHPVFSLYRTETEMMRYLHHLADKDLSLTRSMIALGSCTMKLNAASEMQPVSWPEFAHVHPFAPQEQTKGYRRLFAELEAMLCDLTGFDGFSLQPNAGSQGEYAGLLAIRRYHEQRGDSDRVVCLIPRSAHGTNPASAVMAGLSVLPVACDDQGNIEIADLREKAAQNADRLAALMVTYPSHARGLRGDHPGALRDRARARRSGLHGRGQFQRDGGPLQARRPGRRRLSPQPAQDLLHPAWRRRSGRGPDRSGLAPGSGASRARCRADGEPECGGRRRRRSLGQRQHPADLLDVHPHDGDRGARRGQQDRHPQRQLHRRPARAALSDPLHGERGTGRTRVHPRSATPEEVRRRRGGGRRQATHRLRLPRAHRVVAGGGHLDGGADGEREPRRARPLLRGHDPHP